MTSVAVDRRGPFHGRRINGLSQSYCRLAIAVLEKALEPGRESDIHVYCPRKNNFVGRMTVRIVDWIFETGMTAYRQKFSGNIHVLEDSRTVRKLFRITISTNMILHNAWLREPANWNADLLVHEDVWLNMQKPELAKHWDGPVLGSIPCPSHPPSS